MNDFSKGLLFSALPTVSLSLISTSAGTGTGLYPIWFVAAIIWLVSGFTVVGLLVTGKRRYLSGVIAGVTLGLLALGATCLANIFTAGPS